MDITQLEKIKKSLQNWIASVYTIEHETNPINLHIDEIETFRKITRVEWLEYSFFVFKILLNNFKIKKPLIIFLHIDLSYSRRKTEINKINLDWLSKNLGEYTPPSWHCTTLDYYNNFYKKECIECSIDETITDLLDSKNDLVFLYRTYFEESEEMFSRELYIFSK